MINVYCVLSFGSHDTAMVLTNIKVTSLLYANEQLLRTLKYTRIAMLNRFGILKPDLIQMWLLQHKQYS